MSNDDETAAMRARFDAWRRKFNGCLVYDCDFTGYADFATAEVARALAEERAKTSVFIDGKAVGVADGKFHHVSIVSGPLASTGMASAGPPVCKIGCGRAGTNWCSVPCRDAGRPLNHAPNLSPGLKRDVEPSSIPGRLPCRCGSGAHPRHCQLHPERYREHCDALSEEYEEDDVPASDRAALMADTVDADFPLSAWPIREVLSRLADATEHLLDHHNCDCLGHEGKRYAARAARMHLRAIPPNEAADDVPAPATTGPAAACPHCDEDGLCSVCDEDTQDPGPLTPQRAAPAAPALRVTCPSCRGLLGRHEVFCGSIAARLTVACNQHGALAIARQIAPLVREVTAVEAERDALKARVAELEAEKAAAEEELSRQVSERRDAVKAWAVADGQRASFKADLEAQLAGNAAYRKRFGARDNETMEMFFGRLVAERAAAIAEKDAAVLAERERVDSWWKWWRNEAQDGTPWSEITERRKTGIERGEAAPK